MSSLASTAPPRTMIAAAIAVVAAASCLLDSAGQLSESGGGATTSTPSGGAAGSTTSTGGQTATGGQPAGGGGHAGGGGGEGGAGGGPTQLHRRNLLVTAAVAVPEGYAVWLSFDHGALVNAAKSLASGDDVRVWRDAGGSWLELPRVVDPASSWNDVSTMIWFRTVAPLAAGSSDSSYYLYYGDPTLPAPGHGGAQVYDIWDDFEDGALDPAWTLSIVGTASGAASEASGVVHLEGSTGDLWNQSDDFLFLQRQASGDFAMDARVSGSGGSLGGWAKLGGVMLRQSLAPGSRNRIMSPVNGSAARTNSYRLQDGGGTSEQAPSGSNPIPEHEGVTREGDSSRAFTSVDGTTWGEVGGAISFDPPLTDPVLVGVPLATLSGGTGWVEVDWFRLRKLVQPEPSTSLGGEEQAPF